MREPHAPSLLKTVRGNAFIPCQETVSPLNRLFTGFHAAAAKARHGNWDDFESALHEFDALPAPGALDWLKPDAPHLWSLGGDPECRRPTRDGSLIPAAVPRMCTWGIARGGWCLTAPLKPDQGAGEGCSLARILVPDAPERYFLSAKQMEKLLYRAKTDTTGMSVLDGDEVEPLPADSGGCGEGASGS